MVAPRWADREVGVSNNGWKERTDEYLEGRVLRDGAEFLIALRRERMNMKRSDGSDDDDDFDVERGGRGGGGGGGGGGERR